MKCIYDRVEFAEERSEHTGDGLSFAAIDGDEVDDQHQFLSLDILLQFCVDGISGSLNALQSLLLGAAAHVLPVLCDTKEVGGLRICIVVAVSSPVTDVSTLRYTLLPIVHITEPVSVFELCGHGHLEIVRAKGRRDDGHVAIDAFDDVVHIDGRVDAGQESLEPSVLLHKFDELRAVDIEEHADHVVLGH